METFYSYKEFSEHTMKATMSKTTVSFGFTIPKVFHIGFNYDESKYKKSVQKLSSYAGKVKRNTYTHTHTQFWNSTLDKQLTKDFANFTVLLELAKYK